MKNIIKKINIFALALVTLFATATPVFAGTVSWANPNTFGPIVNVSGNSIVQSKRVGTTNYYNTSSVNAGDKIAVIVYFHNNGNADSPNTLIKLSQPTGTANSFTFYGSVEGNGVSKSGQTTVSVGSNQTISYIPGSLRVSKDRGAGYAVANDTDIFGGGLNIGNVPGMNTCGTDALCHQGSVAVAFQVSNNSSSMYACNDGLDNDGDGYIDYPNDPGCYSSTDDSEYNDNNQSVCRIDTFYPSNSTVSSGSTVVLYWQTTNCTTLTIDGINYPVDGSGTFGPLYGGRTYVLYASNNYNSVSESEYVGIYNNNPTTYACNDGIDNDNDGYRDYPNDPGCYSYTDNDEYNYVAQAPTVTTLSPSNLTSTSGQINGSALNLAGGTSQVYFEWGTSASNLANTTSSYNTTSTTTVTFWDTIYGLSTGTTYYYRAVLKTNNGTVYRGDVKEFRLVGTANPPVVTTPTTVVTTPIIRNVTTTVTTPTQPAQGIVVGLGTNLVQLRYINDQFVNTNNSFGVVNTINNGAQNVCVDDTAKFVVEYKNISNIVLTNAILHIDIPKDVEFRSTGAGVFNKADNTITVNVGTLNPEQSGIISFDGVVLDSAANRDLLVVPATLSFENPNNGARETAVAYGLATTQNCVRNNNLAGFAFGSGFFPNTLIGWLILALVLLTLVYIIRRWLSLPPVLRATDKRRMVERHYEDLDVPTAPYRH